MQAVAGSSGRKEKWVFWILVLITAALWMNQGMFLMQKPELSQGLNTRNSKVKGTSQVGAFPEAIDLDFLKKKAAFSKYSALIEKDPFLATPKVVQDIVVEDPIVVAEETVSYSFQGLVTIGGKLSAIIKDDETGKSSFVKEGAALGDYVVESIGEGQVILKNGEGALVLER